MAIGNNDFTHEAFIATGNRPITGMYALEVDHQGIVDLSVGFQDGSVTPWAFHEPALSTYLDADNATLRRLPPCAKMWSNTVPRRHWATGLGLRTQHHFGIVDLILRVNTSPVPSRGSYLAPPSSPIDPSPWELVQGPAED